MKKKNIFVTIGIILTTVLLAGIAIFTAIRLYQTRQTAVAPNAPESKPNAAAAACSLNFNIASVTPTPSPTINCTSLTSSKTENLIVGDTITGTCRGNYSLPSTPLIARFEVTIDGVSLGTTSGIPLQSGMASYTVTIPKKGNYTVRCQICTDGILPNCTTMEDVDSSAACRLSLTVGVPTPSPTATATATSTATATATSTSTTVASPTPTASPNPQCNNSCTSNSNCPSGLMCYIASGQTSGSCRNTQCLSETDCSCPVATSTVKSTTQPSLPVVGTTWPTILGTGFGILVIVGSLLLAL